MHRAEAAIIITIVDAAGSPSCSVYSELCLCLGHTDRPCLTLSHVLVVVQVFQVVFVLIVEAGEELDESFRDNC